MTEEDFNQKKIKIKTESDRKLLTLKPELIKEIDEYAEKWCGGSFSAFVVLMFQVFKKHMGNDPK